MTISALPERTAVTVRGRLPLALTACLVLSLGLASTAAAEGTGLRVNGFGTAGIAYVDKADGWAYSRNLVQAIDASSVRADLDSRLGLQLNYQPSQQFELVAQVLASHLDPQANALDAVQLGFAAYRPDANWTLRVGRVNLDAYALSDHRDVGLAYDFLRPPVEFYSRIPPSLDGADISRIWMFGEVQWRATLLAGRTSAGIGPVRLRLRPLFGVTVLRESNGLVLRASAIHSKFANNLGEVEPLLDALHGIALLPQPQVAAEAAMLAASLTTRGSHAHYGGIGAQYDRNDWLVSAEINALRVPHLPLSSFTTGYASLGRRFGAVTVFLIESVADRSGAALSTPDWATPLAPFGPAVALQAQAIAAVATPAANTISGQQQTTSLGIRWNVAPKLALKAQWDHIHVEADGGSLWRRSTPAEERANVIGVALDFVF